MKQTFTFLTYLVLTSLAHAQVPFIQQVTYRGAFAPSPAPMWTDAWTEWDPNSKVYPATTQSVSANITVNTTWTSNNVYLLQGVIYVTNNATLTIEPGTVIRGDATVANTSLIITRGAKLYAQGTACNPIVFTSSKVAGARAPGDWGGVILLGRASNNKTGGVGNIEGLTPAPENTYGGGITPDDNDTSGVLKYVRIEFGGYVFQANVEINGLTMGAVGRGTILDYIQSSFTNDDSFEWFGGTVNASHLVAYRGVDDNWDTDNGYSGKVQFALGVRDPDLYDPTYAAASGASTSEGFESDNDANGSALTPQTSAVFTNVTDIGPYRGSLSNTIGPGFRRGARLRRNTALKIFNSILMDHPRGLHIDGPLAESNATNGLLKFRNNIVAGNETGRVLEENAGSTFNIGAFFASSNNDSLVSTAGILVTPYNFTSPDYRPASGSPALSDYDFSDPAFAGSLIGTSFIQQVTYRGAFAPAPAPMWTDAWTEWDPNSKVYPATTQTVSANITVNTTWTSNNVYLLQGVIYVTNNATLTIEPGTVIRGDATVANTSLIITRGAKLYAQGTACNPIVFTSSKVAGARAPGDWGGVILLGRASNNKTGGVGNIEGLTPAPENTYGGGITPDDNDTSGVLKYVRIEFGGYVFQANVEINGLTMGAVGRGTILDYIQSSFTNDDSFEWFGGTVNASHLVAYRGVDDNWDTDNGYSGKVQFALGVRDPDLYDPTYAAASGASTSEGFESDNDANGSALTPQTSAVFTNVTDIGPYRGSLSNTIGPGFRRGARLRRNTALKIFNSILMDHPRGLHIDGPLAESNATNGLLKFRNNIVAGNETGRVLEENAGSTFNIGAFFASSNNDSLVSTAGILVRPYEFLTPDYRPAPNSPALTNYDFSDATLPITLLTFTGEVVKSDNVLYWETGTEINNSGFEILRSIDGQSYNSISFVPSVASNGNSSLPLKYSFRDRNVYNNESYYRLKQVDKNGRTQLSYVIALSHTAPAMLNLAVVYPNPVNNSLNFVINSPVQQDVTVVINDAFGRKVLQKRISLISGYNNTRLNVHSISTGSYFVSIIPLKGGAIQAQKFVKQ